jgi:hypothetical protein
VGLFERSITLLARIARGNNNAREALMRKVELMPRDSDRRPSEMSREISLIGCRPIGVNRPTLASEWDP